MKYRLLSLWACVAALVGAAFAEVRAEPATVRTFDGPETTWKLLEPDAPSRVLAQECVPGGARGDGGFERVTIAAPAGQSALLACSLPRVAALDELQVRLWAKASRPDVQLALRIALPRSIDPQRNAPLTTIVKGSQYTRPGQWQELIVTDIPKLLAAEIRVMRANPGMTVDPREAYIDAVVLVVPGEPGGVEVGTDQLEVDGVLLGPMVDRNVTLAAATAGGLETTRTPVGEPQSVGNGPGPVTSAATTSPARLQGTTLYVEGKPFLPRVIQWNGEPLQALADRGFNVVRLAAPPAPQQIADAQRHALWFMATPPKPDTIARDGIGQAGDRVLAWCLDDEAIDADPSYALRWVETIRERDAVFDRPIVISPAADGAAAGCVADILLARHPRISRLAASEYDEWLAEQPRLARPGTPLWAGLSTQFGEAVRVQSNVITGQAVPAPAVDTRQLESLIQVAATRGVRGFVFQSGGPLTETDAATQRRAALLELMNRRLQLIEPWLASGKVVGRLTSTNGASTGIVLYVDRARLLMPLAQLATPTATPPTSNTTQTATATANAAATPPSKEIVFLVPGVPESSQVFVVSPAAMRLLPAQRVTGGMRVTLPPSGEGFVVLTEDPRVVQGIRQHIARLATRTAQSERDVARQQLQSLYETDRRLAQLGTRSVLDAAAMTLLSGQFAQLEAALAAGQLEQAHESGAIIRQILDARQKDQRAAVGGLNRLESNPASFDGNRLAEFAALERTFDSLRGGDNMLPGGDFEDLAEMNQSGWQHINHPAAGVETRAELSTLAPQHGSHCLELTASAPAAAEAHAPADFLIWIASPPVRIDPQNTVEVTGWVRIDQPFTGTGQGLTIMDSLGGPEVALVVDETSGWQMFRLIRAVAETTEMRLTFALTGLGSAKIDGVMIRTLQQPVARRLPEVPPPSITRLPGTNDSAGPVSAAPQAIIGRVLLRL